jgi:hypothetical protein
MQTSRPVAGSCHSGPRKDCAALPRGLDDLDLPFVTLNCQFESKSEPVPCMSMCMKSLRTAPGHSQACHMVGMARSFRCIVVLDCRSVICGVVNVPASLDADSVHRSPLLVLTGICSEFTQPTGPLFGTSPVHVRVQNFAFGQFQLSVAGCPHGAGAVKFALQVGGPLVRSAAPSLGMSDVSGAARSWVQSSPFGQRSSKKESQTELQPTRNRNRPRLPDTGCVRRRRPIGLLGSETGIASFCPSGKSPGSEWRVGGLRRWRVLSRRQSVLHRLLWCCSKDYRYWCSSSHPGKSRWSRGRRLRSPP